MIKVLTLILVLILIAVFIVRPLFLSIYRKLKKTEEGISDGIKKIEEESRKDK